MNLLYFVKFKDLKRSLTAENYDNVRKQLIMLLQQINQDPQAEFIDTKLHTYISDLLQEITERFDES